PQPLPSCPRACGRQRDSARSDRFARPWPCARWPPTTDAAIPRRWKVWVSRGDLLSWGEIRAAFRSRKHLVRVATVLWIENAPQRAHRIQVVLRKLFFHEIDFFDADAVLAGHAAAEFDALAQNVMSGGESTPHLVRIAFIIKHERMNVAVAGVENIRDAQPMPLTARADETHHLRQFAARHHAVLRQEIRAQTANGAERALAAFPKVHALLLRFGHAHFAGAILFANLNDALRLALQTRGQPIQFDDQHRARIQWKPKMIRRFNRLRDELVH